MLKWMTRGASVLLFCNDIVKMPKLIKLNDMILRKKNISSMIMNGAVENNVEGINLPGRVYAFESSQFGQHY